MDLKRKSPIWVAILLVFSVLAFYYLFALLLPFVIGLVLAFICLPAVKAIQKLVKIGAFAKTLFLVGSVSVLVLFTVLLGSYINNDFKRLENSFRVLSSQNGAKINAAESTAKKYIALFYDVEKLESKLKLKTDSLNQSTVSDSFGGIDTKAIEDSFSSISGSFGSNSSDVESKNTSVSTWSIIVMSLSYFVLILFNIEYFESLRKRYVGTKLTSQINTVASDFNQSFVKYFSLRGKIVILLASIYLIAFILLDIPGLILFTFLIILLSFIPYLQYIVLIPMVIPCLALSVEGNHSFLFYYGIVVGVFALASIIEEFVLNPKIMEKNIGINPVIMVLSISVWTYILGLPGLLIGIPLTSLCIIYLKRYVEPLIRVC